MDFGILLQGRITKWTKSIIQEYKENFPDAKILLSAWENENTDDIDCEIITSTPPKVSGKSKSTVNFQIVGTNAGLKKIDSEIIMKCRTDQFIHNPNIFQIYLKNSYPNRIMVPDFGTFESIQYRTSDFCQIATKKLLEDFWSTIPLYDETNYEEAGVYLTKNYVKNIKTDNSPWKDIIRKYFCVKSYFDDFQIEWEKLNHFDEYQKIFFDASLEKSKPE